MTGEAELLLTTLRGRGTPAPQTIDWQAVLELAESHGVLPLFCRKYSGELPETIASHARSEWTISALLASELEGLLAQFNLHGIEVMPLKGPLLAELLYGSPGIRSSDDLDLLVQSHDFHRARTLLIDLGFAPVYEMDDYHQAFHRAQTLVELHLDVAPPSSPVMDLAGAWRRARVTEFRGQKTRLFAKTDLLLYLTIHGIKHEFARLIWVLDAVHALADLDESDLNQLLPMAQAIGIEGALLTTCELARSAFHAELPRQVEAAIARKPVVANQAAIMWEKIMAGPASPETSHQGAGLFVQLEPDARRRWAQRMRLLQPTQQDHLWAQQHSVHPRWMLVLRPMRLLSKHGPAAVWRTLFPSFRHGH